jgi:hypothetical protein
MNTVINEAIIVRIKIGEVLYAHCIRTRLYPLWLKQAPHAQISSIFSKNTAVPIQAVEAIV